MNKIEKLRQEAREKMLLEGPMLRSCWNCNPAHEHLKKSKCPIVCFECKHWYYKGHDITEEKDD